MSFRVELMWMKNHNPCTWCVSLDLPDALFLFFFCKRIAASDFFLISARSFLYSLAWSLSYLKHFGLLDSKNELILFVNFVCNINCCLHTTLVNEQANKQKSLRTESAFSTVFTSKATDFFHSSIFSCKGKTMQSSNALKIQKLILTNC